MVGGAEVQTGPPSALRRADSAYTRGTPWFVRAARVSPAVCAADSSDACQSRSRPREVGLHVERDKKRRVPGVIDSGDPSLCTLRAPRAQLGRSTSRRSAAESGVADSLAPTTAEIADAAP